MILTSTRTELLDDRADLRAEFNNARNNGNKAAMSSIMTDIVAIDAMLATNPIYFELETN